MRCPHSTLCPLVQAKAAYSNVHMRPSGTVPWRSRGAADSPGVISENNNDGRNSPGQILHINTGNLHVKTRPHLFDRVKQRKRLQFRSQV